MPTLRLVTVDARTEHLDQDALARRIAAAGADLVCVHGAPSLLRWRSACAALARRAGLVVVTGGRTAGGNLLLANLGVDAPAVRDLAFAGHRGPRPPGAALAAMARLGSAFTVAGVRFGAGDQRAQWADVERALRELDPAGPPSIVCTEDAGPAVALALQDGRQAAGPGVFVDARIELAAQAGDTLDLVLP